MMIGVPASSVYVVQYYCTYHTVMYCWFITGVQYYSYTMRKCKHYDRYHISYPLVNLLLLDR